MTKLLLALMISFYLTPFSLAHEGHDHGDEKAQPTKPVHKKKSKVKLLPRPAAPLKALHSHAAHDHGLETENLFGFTLGSDTEHVGSRGLGLETVVRFGKDYGSSYSGTNQKLEYAIGITNDFSLSLSVLAARYALKNNPYFDDTNTTQFNGVGGELRYRFLNRATHPFGLTLHLEPSLALSDETSGQRGVKYGSENKLIFDKELVKNDLFVALNLLHEVEYVKQKGEEVWEKGTKAGVGVAFTTRVRGELFMGAEIRYLRAYEGFALTTYLGDALYVGPTLFAKLSKQSWISASWNAQVRGQETDRNPSLNLTNFERHQVRLKAGYEF